MFHELLPSQYSVVRPLVQELSFRPAIDAVIAGTCPGRVFVDQLPEPRTCFIWEGPGPLYVAGCPHNDAFNEALAEFVAAHYIPQKPSCYPGYFVYSPADWEESLPMILRERPPMKSSRTCFVMPPARAPGNLVERGTPPEGFALRWVDAALIGSKLKNIDDLKSELNHMWRSTDEFLRLADGAYTTRDDELTSWCLMEYVSEGKCGIGVETVEEYQRKGLATAAACALIGRATSEGYTVHWDAWQDNIASQVVARKVGFPVEFDYPVFFFRHGEFENLVENGYWSAFMLNDYEVAEDYLARAFDLDEPAGRHYYLLARVQALAGKPEEALEALSPELVEVRELAGWKTLVASTQPGG